MTFGFQVEARSTETEARTGALSNSRGVVHTPTFMPVGTQATVKAMTVDEVQEIGAELIVCNTYHLMVRPGEATVQELGGLHKFMNWPRLLLTDSGGYQAFSLAATRQLKPGGIRFRSHVDGTEFFLSPKRSVEIQLALDSDIVMSLYECTRYPVTAAEAQQSMELSLAWEKTSLETFHYNDTVQDKALFGIVQGSVYTDLRATCLERLLELSEQSPGAGFAGMALGGLAIGEPVEDTRKIVATLVPRIPESLPRYLMGMGTPEDLVEGVAAGADLFDCVIPTRCGRNGQYYTTYGELSIRNARFARDERPLQEDCPCTTCRNYSRAYLRHLFVTKEILASRLGTYHNLFYYLNLIVL